MKITNITAHNIPDAWFQALWQIMQHGRDYKVEKGSFEGHKRKEFDFVQIQITNPGMFPLAPNIPPGQGMPPPATEESIEDYFNNYIADSYKTENEQYTYGERIWKSFNQIIEMLSNSPGTNQATAEIAYPEDIELSDPPCLRLIDCRVQDSKLHFFVYFRSWDLWSGFPVNLGGIQLLKENIADIIGVQDGEIIASSKGLHLYDFCFDFARQRTYQKK